MGEQRRPWTSTDNDFLIEYWEVIGSVVLIAQILGRSPSSVQTQASRLNLPRRYERGDKHRRPWTDEDSDALDDALANLMDADGAIPIKAVAEQVGRSIDAVVARLASQYDDPQVLLKRIVMPPSEKSDKTNDAGTSTKRRRAPDPKSAKDVRKNQRKRTCLSCLESFWSEGAHNRICPKCKRRDNDFEL